MAGSGFDAGVLPQVVGFVKKCFLLVGVGVTPFRLLLVSFACNFDERVFQIEDGV
jgi:hypothetical protein